MFNFQLKSRKNLILCNITFLLVTIVCTLLNYVGQVHGIWICRHIRPLQGVPYILIAGTLSYSKNKLKNWTNKPEFNNVRERKLSFLSVLIFISYFFQYMIAYPLHVINGDSEENLAFLKIQFYFTCACIVGYTVLLVVQGFLILFMVKLTREQHLIL